MARWNARIAFFVILFAALGNAQDPCSGHGTIPAEGGACVCSSPLPSPTPVASGWVGDQCEQEVQQLPVSGVDTPYTLAAGASMCWAASLWGYKQPNYFVASVTLAAESTGSLKLYGLLAADPALTGGTDPLPIIYPHSAPGEGAWDYLVQVGLDSQPHAVMSLAGQAVAAVAQQAIYLCASNPADAPPVSFILRAAGHSCPVTLHDNGFVSICSSTPEDVRYSSDVCPTGACACTGVYSKPAAPVDAGLGFESCSAPIVPLPEPATPGIPASFPVPSHAPNTWHYFNVTLGPLDKHLAVVASALAATTSRLSLHVRPLQPPGRTTGSYVSRSDWSDFTGDMAVTLQMGAGRAGPQLSPGVWYVGVYVWGDAPASYTLSVRRSGCAGLTADCEGRGTCDATTSLCTCTTKDAAGPDCSSSAPWLALGVPLSSPPRTFAQDDVMLGGLAGALTLPTVTLNIRASFSVKDPLPAWVTARPVLLISPAGAQGAPPPPPPTPETAAFKLFLTEPNKDVTLTLDRAQLAGSGQLQLVVWNPLSSPYQVGYSLLAELAAQCLDDCTGHGNCVADGRCACLDGWAGATCSVDLSAFSNGTTAGCTPGSRVPLRREEQKATCWAPCDADTGKFDETLCVDFTCDPQAPDGQPQRRAGGQELCVVDLCGPAGSSVTVTDTSGQFVCDRQCLCPADGGVCALEPACLPDTFRCLDGLVPLVAPDGTKQCASAPAPGVCEEGALRLAIPLDGGAAYSVCVCTTPPPARQATTSTERRSLFSLSTASQRPQAQPGPGGAVSTAAETVTGVGLGDGTQCAWTTLSSSEVEDAGGMVPPTHGVVVCVGGYEVYGAAERGLPLSDGRTLTSGGRCARVQTARRGVSGGMVFFWCLFSVALAASMVVGGRRALDWYEARRWDLGAGDSSSGGGGGGLFGLAGYVKLGMENLLSRRDGGGGGGGDSNNRW